MNLTPRQALGIILRAEKRLDRPISTVELETGALRNLLIPEDYAPFTPEEVSTRLLTFLLTFSYQRGKTTNTCVPGNSRHQKEDFIRTGSRLVLVRPL